MLTRYPIGLAATAVALAVAGRRLAFVFGLVSSGRPTPGRLGKKSVRARLELEEVVEQRRLLRWRVPGVAHAFTFWGFCVLILTIVEAYGGLFRHNFSIPGIGHAAVVGFGEDFSACAVLVAVFVFGVIRLRSSPKREGRASRFYGSRTAVAWITLGMIALVVLTLLVYRAAQTNTGDFPYGWRAFASHELGRALAPLGVPANRTIETVFIDLNVVVVMAFLVLVVYTKHLHIVMAPLNVACTRQPSRLGALDKTPEIDLETMDEDTDFGAGRIDQFTWKQLLDLVTCTECGRCQASCPAWNTGKALSPKLLVMDLREELFRGTRQALLPNVIAHEVLCACTTCGASENAAIVANLTATGSPTLNVFGDPTSSLPMGDARVIIRHVADAPGVDVYAGNTKVASDLTNPLKATLVIPAGKVTVKVDVANTSTTVIGPATFDFKAGTTTVIYAIGSAAGKTLTVAVQTYS
ncbi:MAG: hypothetical protein ABSF89_16660, partial [Acidimicrobiales bacterium]